MELKKMIEKEYIEPAQDLNQAPNPNADTDSLESFKTAQDVLMDLNLSKITTSAGAGANPSTDSNKVKENQAKKI